jgi:hypothetical protein
VPDDFPRKIAAAHLANRITVNDMGMEIDDPSGEAAAL